MIPETSDWRLPLGASVDDLDRVGGKAINLMRLYRDGLPVPPGFVLTTDAYRAFVAANELAERIHASLASASIHDSTSLEAVSAQIRGAFVDGHIPAHVQAKIEAGYAELGDTAVAVRSSATAEDLPEMSFAGQQDTFLNVRGESQLLDAVVKCWSSLWTARAIGYRARNQVDHSAVALAVIVQQMVPSEASGVLFTANPLSGKRDQTVIDATLGLGEALVAGEVEPDHYVVSAEGTDRFIEKTLGAKALVIQPDDGGGVARRPAQAAEQQALPDHAIHELTRLGERSAELLGGPQDVEWAWANGELVLLQSRPITSLFPLPERLPRQPLRVLMSFGAPQGVLDPITPLGRDVIKALFVNTANRLNFRVELDTQTVLYSAAERLFINITGPLRSPVGRRMLLGFLGIAEPGIARGLMRLQQKSELPQDRASVTATLSAVVRLLPFLLRLVLQIVLALLAPVRSRQQLAAKLARTRQQLRRQRQQLGSNAEHVEYVEQVLLAFPRVVHELMARVAASMLALNLLRRTCGEQALNLTRGLPHNVTTEMDLALWRAAQAIRADEISLARLLETAADELADQYLHGSLPPPAQNALQEFLERYGMRGAGEIDLGRPRWREEPTPVLQVLRSYLQIEDRQQAPDAVFARGAAQAEMLIDQLAAEAGGPLRSQAVHWLARRVRELGGLREAPKFFIVSLLGHGRESMLTVGRHLVERAVLGQVGDVFYLRLHELHALAADGHDPADVRQRVQDRRLAFERERRRRQLPRLLLSDGRTLYAEAEASGDEEGGLVGSPVSPGVVEGRVRVVFDPQRAELEPGEILVCPGTDPGWTPLFLAAGGLVTEVGGLMTHGSVVAREYGIPAVVGVQNATERLRTGQRVRLDGSSGRIELVQETAAN